MTHLDPMNTPLPMAKHIPTILNFGFALSPTRLAADAEAEAEADSDIVKVRYC
jgi:hypothetical protein